MKLSRASVRAFLLGAVICLVLVSPGRADFVVSGGSAAVAPGGTGTVDFTITSDSSAGDNLALVNLEMQISVVSGTSLLQFTSNQPDFSAVATYVFAGNSSNGAAYWGAPFSTATANDTIAGGDFTGDLSDVTITSSSRPLLLARVQFQADPNALPGDSFHISLVPQQTSFLEASDLDPPLASTTPATVAVEEANTVPAPPSVVLAGLASLGGILSYWKRRRQGLLTACA